MKKHLTLSLIFLLGLFTSLRLPAQELLCTVSVSAPQLQSDRDVYDQMQKAIMEYMNNRKWTQMVFEQKERIKVSVIVLISERPDIDRFKGTFQMRIIRPVYNSTYETVLVNLQDKDFSIRYVPFQTLEFSENNYIDNLTCTLNFYANFALGMDFASFSPSGGVDFFSKMQTFVSLASGSQEPGWNSFDGVKSRYRLTQEINGGSFKPWHGAMYTYHRLGLDMMEKDMNKARTNILTALKELQKVNAANPGSYLIRLFMDAKQPEIVNIFMKAMPNEKQQLLSIMETLDAPQLTQYQKILENK